MAVSLCSDWGTMERAMVMNNNLDINGGLYQQFPTFGFLGTSPSGLDISDQLLLEHLLEGGPIPDDCLLQDPSLDPLHLSSLLSSFSDPSAAMFSTELCLPSHEFDVYGTSSSFLFNTNIAFDGRHPSEAAASTVIPSGGTSCLEPQFLSQFAYVPAPPENPSTWEIQTPPPATAAAYTAGGYTGRTTASGVGGCPSAQSVAARQRRKRISEKTHELGHLVPGGSRMNTAEMLQAAFKYVKFLQAQVGILDLMSSSSQDGEVIEGRPGQEGTTEQFLQALLVSSAVQEKLAKEERCVVPQSMVRELMEDRKIKSHPSICKDLAGLTASMG